MTIHPESPDYSSVPPIAYNPKDINDLKEMVRYLSELKVPTMSILSSSFTDEYGKNRFLLFKAPFATIHKEWEEGKAKEISGLVISDNPKADFVGKPTLLVPTQEEIYNHCQIYFGSENNSFAACKWMRDEIIKRNK